MCIFETNSVEITGIDVFDLSLSLFVLGPGAPFHKEPCSSGGSERGATGAPSSIPSVQRPLNFLWALFPISYYKEELMGLACHGNGSYGNVYTALREGSLAGAWCCKYNRNPPAKRIKCWDDIFLVSNISVERKFSNNGALLIRMASSSLHCKTKSKQEGGREWVYID